MCSCSHCWSGKSNKCYVFWVCVNSLRYPACNARAPYCHLWPVRLCYIFPHYLTNGTMFENKLLNIASIYRFSLYIFTVTFLVLRRIQLFIINAFTCSHIVAIILIIYESDFNLRATFFWVNPQGVAVLPHRHFERTNWWHLDPWRWDQ